MRLVLTHYPVDSIRDIASPWKQAVVTVNNVSLSLNDIEHRIIRAIFNEPRIHYAVNCASIGCPNLADMAYTAETLEEMLESAAREYINHPRGVSVDNDGDITVSKIYGWFKEDFGKSEKRILQHINQYADDGLRARLNQVDDDIDDYAYDWSLNGAVILP